MSTEISPRVRLIAIAGGVVALLLGGGTMVMSRAAAAGDDEPIVVAASASPLPNVAQAPAPAAEGTAPAAAAAAAVAPAPKPAPQSKPKRKPKPKPLPPVAANGLPMSIAVALRRHEVVVVSLFAPSASVDALAVEEARAGAKAANAGFVALNVLEAAQGKAIARLVGVAEPPAVLVYRSPDVLAFHLDGFADVDTVAQAAESARS